MSAMIFFGVTNGAWSCERYAAPFFQGNGGFVVEPSDGRSAEVTVQGSGASETQTVFARRDGLVVQLLGSPLCTTSAGGARECGVTFSGVRGGGWYWVNGEHNAAVAPLICEDDLGGGAPALDPGGVETIRGSSGTGTLFVHDTQGLMGIVPHLSPPGPGETQSCERYVAPFFRGTGGFVARPEGGGSLELTIGRDSSMTRRTLQPRSDGLVVQLLSDSRCTDSSGEAAECQVSFTGIGDGGWYWVNGDRNAAVAPLMCEGNGAGTPALDPRGVDASRAAFGTGSLFVHDTQRLMGIVPHVSDAGDDERQVEIRVSVFGGGTVEAVGDGELNCPVAKMCAGSFPAAGSLTLRATRSFGFAFDRWEGCDSVSGADCVIALHADRQVSVDFLSTQPLALKDNVVSFDERRLNDVQQYDPRSGLMILTADARVDDIGIGSILVSSVIDPARDFESHFLRRVTDLSQLAGSPAYLKTTHATLEDLIAVGSLAVREPLGADSVSSYTLPPELAPISHRASELTVRELPDGRRAFKLSRQVEPLGVAVPPPFPALEDVRQQAASSPIEFAVSVELADGVEVTGTIGFSVEPSFLLSFERFRPQEFSGLATIESRATIEVDVDAGVVAAEYRYPLDQLDITFGAIVAGPVVIVPSLTGNLFLKVNLEAGFEPAVELVVEATAGAHWVRGEGWTGIWEFDRESGVDILGGVEARASAEVGVVVDLKTKVYALAGPTIGVGPTVGVSAFILKPARGSCAWDYEAHVGGKAEYGGELKVFGWGLEFRRTLWDGRYTTPLGRYCPEEVDVSPSPPGRLRFPSTATDSIAVEWDAPRQAGGGYAVSYEVVRSYDPGFGADRVESREFEVTDTRFVDTRLFPGAEYCYSVRTVVAGVAKSSLSARFCERTRSLDVAPPSAPTGVTAEARSTGVISLRWSESDDEGVSHYLVIQVPGGNGTDDGVSIGSTKGPSFDVTGLRSNTRYCFGVSAVDDAGNASPVGTAACASTLANSEARWRFRIACRYQEYLLESFIDLDEDFVAVVSVLGEGEDYDGSHLTYALTGPYDNETQVLDGTINWTDDGLSIGRQDTFQADLSLNDTGDIGTSKSGTAAGCDAVIRFDRRDAAAMAGPSSGSAGPGPGGCSGERVELPRFGGQ